MTVPGGLLAICLGIGASVLAPLAAEGAPLFAATAIFAGFFALPALVAAWIVPDLGYRWGVWIVSPFLAVMALSLAFAGYFDVFLEKDLPKVLAAIIGAIGGSVIGAKVSPRRKLETVS